MEYGLAGALAAVQNGSVPIQKISLAGQLRGHKLQFPQDRLVFGRGVDQRFEMLARTNQDVRWSLWVDVANGHAALVLMDEFGRDFTGDDFAEEAIVVGHG